MESVRRPWCGALMEPEELSPRNPTAETCESTPQVLLLDNYDSFTYNLAQAFEILGATVEVVRNDQISVFECLDTQPSHLVISPGPGNPSQAGISLALIEAALGTRPLLGVCLGHQALAQVLGATVGPAHTLELV